MSLRVVVGPMFAGKTSEIQSVIRRYSCLDKRVLVLTADIDNRYQSRVTSVISHDGTAIEACGVPVDGLLDVLKWPDFAAAHAVVVDEAQFFSGCLVAFVHRAVREHAKHLVVVGLDGDSNQMPFGDILQLIPYADSVEKKTAFCRRCGNGTPAIFTRARVTHDTQVAVGGADMYEATCRRHTVE